MPGRARVAGASAAATRTGASEGALAPASLTPPGNSAAYVNPADATDHTLAAGKTVAGRPGVSNSSAVRGALDALKTRDITVPVWDTAGGGGSGTTYHVAAFATVRLLDYRLPGNKDYISVRFLGYTSCGGITPLPSATTVATSMPASATVAATPSPSASATQSAPVVAPATQATTRVITNSYDGLQRLTDAVENPGTSYHYAYDPAGNRTDVVVDGMLDTHHDFDAANGVVGWGYDAAGNVISDTSRVYAYDALNRLTGLAAGPEQRTYAYNGDGTVVSQTVNGVMTQFTQDLAAPASQVLQAQSAGAATDYLYGLDRLAAVGGGTRAWYGADAQGSVRYTMDDAGNTRAPRNYDPYGAPEGAQMPDAFGYTGELQDAATGLEYLRARWYNPAAGQFLSRDPLEGQTGQPYAYADGGPINETDPSGLCGEWYDLLHRTSPVDGACVTLPVYWAQVYALTHSAQDRQGAVNVVNTIRDTYNTFTDASYTSVRNGARGLYATGVEVLRLIPPTGIVLAGGWRDYEVYALTDLSQAAYSADHLDTAWSIVSRGIARPYRMAIMCPSAGTIGTALGDTAVQIVAFFGPAKVLGIVGGAAAGGAADAGDAAAVAGETAELQGATDFLDSSETGFLGGNLYGEENLAALGRYLANRGVDLLVGDRYLPRLPSGGRASGLFIVRAEGRPQLILGDNPTQYQVWHELLHYLHYRRIGRAAYLGLPRSSAWNAAEQAVFDALEDPRRWFRLNEAEREHAIDYIENEGGGFR